LKNTKEKEVQIAKFASYSARISRRKIKFEEIDAFILIYDEY
jgi:hypothetical protein